MPPLLAHIELGLAVWALAGAALRVAAAITPVAAERALAAVPIALAAASIQCLLLGLAGLGSNPHVLLAAALATYAATAIWMPSPEHRIGAALAGWWGARSAGHRALLGAAAGAFLAFAAWTLRHPFLGIDTIQYRLPTVLEWIETGHPGSSYDAAPDFATGSYPLGQELLIHWGMAISRSFVPAGLISPFAILLIALAGWYALRALEVPRLVAALALAAVLTLPTHAQYLNGPSSDSLALALTVCCAALCTAVKRRPALMGPALLAAGLAMGIKATMAVPVAAIVIATCWANRSSLPRARAVVGAFGLVAAGLGGLWYARNLVLHGSPLYPFQETPWGDPSPPLLEALDHSLLERPRATFDGHWTSYRRELSGGLLLLVAPAVALAIDRGRAVLLSAATAGLALLAYAAAPFTGVADVGLDSFPLLTVRYLVGALAACAVALALASRRGVAGRRVAVAALAGVLAWNLGRCAELGFPYFPSAFTLLAGAAAGAALAALTGAAPALPAPRWPAAAATAVALGALLALPAAGFVERNSRISQAPRASLAQFWVSAGAPPTSVPVHFSAQLDARLAGDRLERRLYLLPRNLSCPEFRRRGWAMFTPSAAVLNLTTRLRLAPGPLERCRYSDAPVAVEPGAGAVFRPPGPQVRSAAVPFPGD